MDQIFTAVGQYAFPIVMCLVMAWYVKYTEDKHRDERKDITESHKNEMDSLVNALHNNTLAIQKLTDFMEDFTDGKN